MVVLLTAIACSSQEESVVNAQPTSDRVENDQRPTLVEHGEKRVKFGRTSAHNAAPRPRDHATHFQKTPITP